MLGAVGDHRHWCSDVVAAAVAPKDWWWHSGHVDGRSSLDSWHSYHILRIFSVRLTMISFHSNHSMLPVDLWLIARQYVTGRSNSDCDLVRDLASSQTEQVKCKLEKNWKNFRYVILCSNWYCDFDRHITISYHIWLIIWKFRSVKLPIAHFAEGSLDIHIKSLDHKSNVRIISYCHLGRF